MAFHQSIPISLFYAYFSGLLDVVATAIAAYPGLELKKGREWPTKVWVPNIATILNIIFRLFGMILVTYSTFYGPVSIATPTNQASILICNMIIFGVILRAERFTKEIRLGTYIILLAAILLPVVGADIMKRERILQNLSYPGAATLAILLVIGLFVTSWLLFRPSFKKEKGTQYAFYIILAAQVIPNVVAATLTKMFVLVDGWPLYVCIAGSIYCLVVILATFVQQSKFVPLETSLTIGLNEIAGFLIWHDFLVVQSWVGYACVSLLFMLGSFSLGSIDDEETRGTQTTFTGPYHIEHRYSGFTNAVLLDISQMDKEMKTPLIDEDAI